MDQYHPDVLPTSAYYRINSSALIIEFILQARWYNWSWVAQEEISLDVRRNKQVDIRHAPSGVWLRFMSFDDNITAQQEIFIRLTDIIMMTKNFEVQLK